MALTPAERAKRYRERLKRNPEKYEAHKRKEVARIKKCQKKIAELSDAQKTEKRKVWREQKRKQKEKKSNQEHNNGCPPQEKSNQSQPKPSHSFKIRYKKVCDQYKNAVNKIRKIETVLGSLRKKIHRIKQSHTKEVSSLVQENEKLKARQEIMELTLRDAYSSCKSNKEKLLLKEAAVKHRTGKVLGLKSNIRLSSKKRFENKKAKELLQEFYLRNDISRITSGKRECKTRKKQKEQKRYLVDTLKSLYEIYRKEGDKYGFTSFFIYKPFYVLSPTAASRNTCLCIKHSNMEFILLSLIRNSVLFFRNVKEVLRAISCDIQSFECMYNYCEKCETPSIPVEGELDKEITWNKWARVDHKYEKSGQEKVTKKTDKLLIHGKVIDLVTEFKKQLPMYKTHVYNAKEQQAQYQICVQNLQENEVLILCDFSENYGCKLGEEVQSMHFGASKQDITLHCGMIYTRDKSQSFVTVSDNSSHEPPAIWAHLMPVIKLAKTINPNIRVIHFYSDGPSSQYRQKKNFYLLSIFTSKLQLLHSTWSFTEAGHGKSVADGIGGAAKRQLDKRVGYGYDVTNAQDAFEILKRHIVSVCYLIADSDIEDMSALIPVNIRPVPGTMKLHQVIATEANQIKHRVLSCFCGEKRGLCNCHNPKMHALMPGLTSPVVPPDVPPIVPLPPDVFVANISENQLPPDSPQPTEFQIQSYQTPLNTRQINSPVINVKTHDITSCIKSSTTTPLSGTPKDVNEEILKIDKPPLLSTPVKSDLFEIISPESHTATASSWLINSEIQMALPALSNVLTETLEDVNGSELIVDCSLKPRISDILTSCNKENVDINQSECDLPTSLNAAIVEIDTNSYNTDKIVNINEKPSTHTQPKDLDMIVIDLKLDEEETNSINAMYNLNDLDANYDVSAISGMDSIVDGNSKLLFDISENTNHNKKIDSTRGVFTNETLPTPLVMSAKDEVNKFTETHRATDRNADSVNVIPVHDESAILKTNYKRVSTEAPSTAESAHKKVKIEIEDIKIIANKKTTIKNKTVKLSKPLKVVVKRTLPCNKCKKHHLFYSSMTKSCLKCKQVYCLKCISSSELENDNYVCEFCVEL